MTREREAGSDEKRWISRSLGVYFRSSGGGRAGRGINNYRKKALNWMRRGWKWMIGWSWWSQYKYTDDHNTNTKMITIQIHKWSQYKYTNDQNTNTQMITIQVHRWSQYKYKDLRPNSSESCILSFAFNDALAWEMSYIVHILDQIMMFDLLKKDISSGRLDPLSVYKINLITQIFSDLLRFDT